MFEHRSLRWPITLGVIMFVVLAALLVGWVLLTVFGFFADPKRAGLYIALLSIGAVVPHVRHRRHGALSDALDQGDQSQPAAIELHRQRDARAEKPHRVAEAVSADAQPPASSAAAEQEVFFKDMLEDVERLDQLINHLLDVARLEKDRVVSAAGRLAAGRGHSSLCRVGLRAVSAARAETIKLDLTPGDGHVRPASIWN